MIPRIRPFARLLLALSLMVAWTTSGWAAACAKRPDAAPAHAMAGHAAHHGAMHHHPRPASEPSRPDRGEMPECPLLAMNGGTCTGVAQLPTAAGNAAAPSTDLRGYPPVEPIRDRLLALSVFRPPEA
ncbi:MAG TPA: hypothetical protein VFS20_31165 [Longimicrobium sp.]|nr:hypothetical protein [Longimicrobium sp.]